jgi:5-formyltetrahydrofolate cyclo-ligase
VREAKGEIRRQVLASRAGRDREAQELAAGALADNTLTVLADHATASVCCYLSMPGEPGTGPLVERLHSNGVSVLLPMLLDDLELDWAVYSPGQLRAGRFGIVEPTTPALGVQAVQHADAIVCPGLAGTATGKRLGRGGGSYDRALARARPGSVRVLLLYDDEVLPDVPTEPHDERIDVAVTPMRILRASPARCD